jgi:hypothetical protein
MIDIKERLIKIDIEPDSELGLYLIKLDKTYQTIEDISKNIRYLKDKKQQLKEDVDVMELMLMYKFNKDSRLAKWHLLK